MNIKVLAWSWLWFRRGLRRELRIPLATLALAAAAAGGVALFSAQLAQTVDRAASNALGADLQVRSRSVLPDSLTALAERIGMRHSEVTAFLTVAVADDALKLASIRAVEEQYPLRGKITIRNAVGAPAYDARSIPESGAVWVSPGLLGALKTRIGGRLKLGNKTLRITKLIDRAPGNQLNLIGVSPLLLMNRADLEATGLVSGHSRISHRLLLAGSAGAIKTFAREVQPLLPQNAQLRGIESLTRVGKPLTSTRSFLALALLATLLIAAAALVQSSRSYLAQQRPGAAILKTLGASQNTIRAVYGLELLWLCLTASLVGSAIGWGVAYGLGALATTLFNLTLTPAPLGALIAAPIAVAILGAGFRLVPLLGLALSPPASVLRGASDARGRALINLTAASLATAALIAWQGADTPKLTLWTLVAASVLALWIAGSGFALLRVLGASGASLRPAWRFAMTLLSRRAARSLAELVAFGLALTVILLLTGVRHNLVSTWQAALPADAPNLFVINIQSDQRAGIKQILANGGITAPSLYSMSKARLIAVNGIAASEWKEQLKSVHAKRLLERDQTLSMRTDMSSGTTMVTGEWWRPSDRGKLLVSVGVDWARDMQIELGDRLGFSVAGRKLTLTVASLRKINWRSFEPNFFLVVPPTTLVDYPKQWITAVHASDEDDVALDLVRAFPNLTTIDVGSILTSVTTLLRHASYALAAVFALAVLAAILVLLAALEAGREERRQELALLRVLGARRGLLARLLATEFVTLGAMAGLSAGLVAAGAQFALARWVFDISAYFDGWLVIAGVLAGAIGVGGVGFAATLSLTRSAPAMALRRNG